MRFKSAKVLTASLMVALLLLYLNLMERMQASNIKATRYLRSHDSYCPLCRKKPMMDILRT